MDEAVQIIARVIFGSHVSGNTHTYAGSRTGGKADYNKLSEFRKKYKFIVTSYMLLLAVLTVMHIDRYK